MPGILTKIITYILYGGRSRLRRYEEACLESWKSVLSPQAVAILERQLNLFDFIQRQSKDKLLVFYCFGRSPYRKWPKDALFPQRNEVLAARISFRAIREERTTPLKADVELYEGRLSSITFDHPPDGRMDQFTVDSVDVFADPMVCSEETDTSNALRQVDAVLPDDYISLLKDSKSLRTRGVILLPPPEIWRMPRPDRNYYVLAQIEDAGEIGVGQGTDAELYYLDHEDDEAKPVGRSLREALTLITESKRGEA